MLYNDEYDYFPPEHRNVHFEKTMHGPPPRGPPGGPGPGPHGPPGGPHGGPHMRGGPPPRRRMMGPDNGGGPPPPNFRGPHDVFESDYSQGQRGMSPMNMRGPPDGNMSRGPPPGPHFGGSPQHPMGCSGPRQPLPGMPHKGPQFQRPPMIPPFGVPPPGFSSGGPGAGRGLGGGSSGNQNRNSSNSNHSENNSNSNISNIDLSGELWVETKSSEGKLYYYNARTREATYQKPENVKILHQDQIEALAAATGNSVDLDGGAKENHKNSPHQGGLNPQVGVAPPNQFQFVPMHAMPMGPMPMLPPPGFGMGPPPPFAMPPPGIVTMSPGYPPFGMPPPAFPLSGGPPMPNAVSDNTMLSNASENKTSDENNLPHETTNIDEIWAEYKSPNGQCYFHNKLTGESTWRKPTSLSSNEVDENKIATESVGGTESEDQIISESEDQVTEISTTVMEVDDDFNAEKKPETETPVESNNQMEIQENGTSNNEENSGVDNEESSIVKEEIEPTEKQEAPPKPVDKTRPISCTPISGSPWCVVWTGDNRSFFFNPSYRLSNWERPIELMGRVDVDKLLENPPPQKNSPVKEKPEKSESDSPPEAKKIKLEETEDDDSSKNKSQQDETNLNKNSITPGKEAAMEAELRAAKERASVNLDVRIQKFRDLLIQKNVSAFSTWEKELHKIVFQPEYLLLTSRERKQVFERYVKERAEEERNEKRKKMRERKEDFKRLLDEAGLTTKSTFSDFAQRYGKEDRFKMIEKMRERENMFNDYLSDLRRKERDERSSIRDKAKKEFIELLKEIKLDKHSRYSDVKKSLSDDSRYKNVDSSSLREEWFKEFVTKLSRVDVEDDVSKEREKQERVEASIREREKEVQRTLSTHLREREKERELHKHEEAIQHYKALLTDLVRSPDVTFHEVKKTLRKDHRYEAVSFLEREEREKVFEEHINFLYRKKKEKFRELLDETPEITLTSTWKEIKKLLKDDPRCSKFSSSDRKCEKEFKEYLKDKMVAAKADFRELLKETKIITYKSRKLIEESDHLHDIEKVLQNDKRYLVLQCIEDERQELLMAYIDTLNRKGPPPPPTASEPSRRSTK